MPFRIDVPRKQIRSAMSCKNKILENYFLKTLMKEVETGPTVMAKDFSQESEICNSDMNRMVKEEISDIPLDLSMTRKQEPEMVKPSVSPRELDSHVPISAATPVSLHPHPVFFHMNYRQVIDDFLLVYELLDTDDDVKRKPNYSYSELVFLAIMRSPNFSLPIHEIYRYIETRFSFFRYGTNGHWKNAVRHSLSKTSCFSKIGVEKKAKAIINRSCFLWTILPGGLPGFVDANFRPTVKGLNQDKEKFQFCAIYNPRLREQCVMYLASRVQALRYEISTCTNPTIVFQQQICFVPQLGSNTLGGLHTFPPPVTPNFYPQQATSDRTCVSPPRKRRKTSPIRQEPIHFSQDSHESADSSPAEPTSTTSTQPDKNYPIEPTSTSIDPTEGSAGELSTSPAPTDNGLKREATPPT